MHLLSYSTTSLFDWAHFPFGFVRDIINLYNCFFFFLTFQSKQRMTKKYYLSSNSQFNNVLNAIICFSVRFCDNSLLVLKMSFQVFSFPSKKVQGFSSDRKIIILFYSLLFHLHNCVSVFWNVHFLKFQSHFLKNSDKSLSSPGQKKLKEIWDTV